jgi:hypothetical protein
MQPDLGPPLVGGPLPQWRGVKRRPYTGPAILLREAYGGQASAGPTHHSVIAGIIRKELSDCMNPASDMASPEENSVEVFHFASKTGRKGEFLPVYRKILALKSECLRLVSDIAANQCH